MNNQVLIINIPNLLKILFIFEQLLIICQKFFQYNNHNNKNMNNYCCEIKIIY